jgi:hypothetical protein
MATTATKLPEADLLRSYLRALARHGGAPDEHLEGGRQRRTCAACGRYAEFLPEGTWYRCSACGSLA